MDSSLDPETLAARSTTVRRALKYIREANAERDRRGVGQEDWFCTRARAMQGISLCILSPALGDHPSPSALGEYSRERIKKIRRANDRRATRALYISRLPYYAQKRGSPHPPSLADETWGNGRADGSCWGTCDDLWPTFDAAFSDPGFWMKPQDDDISPILAPRALPLYIL
ncbi:hypothetical protein B0H13DRAFT_2363578 [Mycena leptocephala]|nr:hypothetical protein B0H13DRAFT_2363578 [Mycena leptocephala]